MYPHQSTHEKKNLTENRNQFIVFNMFTVHKQSTCFHFRQVKLQYRTGPHRVAKKTEPTALT